MMKQVPLVKSCIGLLVVAGAYSPHVSVGRDLLPTGINEIQAELKAPAGAQGPVREETTERVTTFGEGAMYDNLRRIQESAGQMASARYGAQGPIRTETPDAQLDPSAIEAAKRYEEFDRDIQMRLGPIGGRNTP